MSQFFKNNLKTASKATFFVTIGAMVASTMFAMDNLALSNTTQTITFAAMCLTFALAAGLFLYLYKTLHAYKNASDTDALQEGPSGFLTLDKEAASALSARGIAPPALAGVAAAATAFSFYYGASNLGAISAMVAAIILVLDYCIDKKFAAACCSNPEGITEKDLNTYPQGAS